MTSVLIHGIRSLAAAMAAADDDAVTEQKELCRCTGQFSTLPSDGSRMSHKSRGEVHRTCGQVQPGTSERVT